MKNHIIVLLLLCNIQGYSQSLITDTVFGNNGNVIANPFPSFAGGRNTNLFKLPDDNILLCGWIYDINLNANNNVMFKVDACGNPDVSFGINGLIHHTFDQRNAGYAYALQTDGKIVVCGSQSSSNAGSQQFPFVARYFANGLPDTTFATMGTNKISNLGPNEFTSIYLMPNGKILCTNGLFMMRFDSTGSVDNMFGNAGVIQLPTPSGVQWSYSNNSIMRSDGKIVSAGTWYTGANTYLGLLCYDTLGVLDTNFGDNGFLFNPDVVYSYSGWQLMLQNDDKVIVAKQNSSETEIVISRHTINGSLDLTFGTSGYINIPGGGPNRLRYISKFNDDKFLIGYQENGVPAQFKKYSADGILDNDFSLNGSNMYQITSSLAAEIGIASENGEIVMGGGSYQYALTRFVLHTSVPHITLNNSSLNANALELGCTFQWYLNGSAISGATDSTYTFSQNGIYTVEVTNIWGCTASDDFTITVTNLKDQSALKDVRVYPNPASNFITVSNPNTENIHATIYDISGRAISNLTIQSGDNTFPLNNYAKGIYIIEFKTNFSSHKLKIIKD